MPTAKSQLLAVVVVLSVLSATGGSANAAARALKADEARPHMRAGSAAFEKGAFEAAARHFNEAQRACERSRDVAGQVEAMIGQATACKALGQVKLAVAILERAEELVRASGDLRSRARVKAAWGAAQMYGSRSAEPEKALREALQLARATKDDALTAQVLNDLAILLSGRGDGGEAQNLFEQARALAQRTRNTRLTAKLRRNLAEGLLARNDFAAATREARAAVASARDLPASHDRAFLLMGCGRVLQEIFLHAPEHDNALRAEAFALHREAQKIAEEIGDERALSYALGYQGAMYEVEKRTGEALALTRRAIFHAQRVQAPDALYRWQWQAGRLLAAEGPREPAVASYRGAVATLQSIRNDVAARFGNRNAGSSFREVAGDLYLELADLLLQEADLQKDSAEIQALLREARDTTEQLKVAELDDYFQDDCVHLLRAKTKKVEMISTDAAVMYVIPLRARTELLLSLPSGELRRAKSPVGTDELTSAVRRFRLNLEDRTTDAFFEQAQQLYAWLIRPIEPIMAAARLKTIVFVPDGALRTVPLAALHDGERFLIEKFAVAVTPGLELMDATPVTRGPSRLLISGLSESVEGFAPLPHVPHEVEQVGRLFAEREELMNQAFRRATVGQKLSQEAFTVVHLASHGQISSDVRESFVLTFDRRLTLDDLERFIRPGQLRDQPLELLSLSACQTAAGDDRAALGLAGVAVKAGARSAFATLWSVNDLASARLVADFYSSLRGSAELSKAEALQRAQRKLLAESRYQHPCFWAPYLIIGNWL